MAAPIPLIICGTQPAIAKGVANGLKPEYEVIHVILTPDDGVATLPALLRGEAPPRADEDNVGTKNYSAAAAAVITGGGYEDGDIARMRQACAQSSTVPWLRPDLDVSMPPLGPAYGAKMVERVRACLQQLREEGKMSSDSVEYF